MVRFASVGGVQGAKHALSLPHSLHPLSSPFLSLRVYYMKIGRFFVSDIINVTVILFLFQDSQVLRAFFRGFKATMFSLYS
jgi:hypothetical protein